MKHKGQDTNNTLSELSFSFRIARRYLFSKKSHNAINLISAISATGIAIGTMALVVVLSVFNGFESLISDMFSTFDPELKITLTKSKTFSANTEDFEEIRKLHSIAFFTEIVEENALLRFKDKQMPAKIKGVGEGFKQMTKIENIIYDGKFELNDGAFERIVTGIGVADRLSLGAHFIDPVYIYAPKRTSNINLLRPENSFNQITTFVSGIFSVQQTQYDDQYVIVSINLARDLFEYDKNTVSAIELKLKQNVDIEKAKTQIEKILGDKFQVKNRFEQQEGFFKIMRIEKWFTFLILSFILLIASFNIIGSLSMLIIEKKQDVITLKSIGANKITIRNIFLIEGWLISVVGAIAGLTIGTALCYTQELTGFIKLGAGYVVESYPVITNTSDILLIFITVLLMGFLAAFYSTRGLSKNL